jgi:DNA-binding beta-propeller fold protein YncE
MERSRRGFPLAEPAWFVALRGFCAVAEGADVPVAAHTDAHAITVATVLGDAQRRLCIFGGRDGMPRSLGSLFGSLVVRFVGGYRGGNIRCATPTPGLPSTSNGVAVSRDGTTLLVSDAYGADGGIHLFRVVDGVYVRTVGTAGDGPLQFCYPQQVWVACDDFVFVADFGNNRIQVLTPGTLDFHGFVGVGQLNYPSGVCGDRDTVFVSEMGDNRVSVFRRADGALLRRFGAWGAGQLKKPRGLCFMGSNRQIAVANSSSHRITVFSVEGEFVRHVGAGALRYPYSVACSAFGELVVADGSDWRISVFRGSGEVLHTIEDGHRFSGVAMRGDTIFAQTYSDKCECIMYT